MRLPSRRIVWQRCKAQFRQLKIGGKKKDRFPSRWHVVGFMSHSPPRPLILMWDLPEALYFYLHDFMHRAASTWLADWDKCMKAQKKKKQRYRCSYWSGRRASALNFSLMAFSAFFLCGSCVLKCDLLHSTLLELMVAGIPVETRRIIQSTETTVFLWLGALWVTGGLFVHE